MNRIFLNQCARLGLILLLSLLVAVIWNPKALASRDVVDVSIEAESEKASKSQARQDIFKKAIEKVSKQYIEQIIGEAKYGKHKTTIENKIIRQSGKYVMFIKSQSSEPSEEGGVRMTVAMKISLKSLQKLLLEQGLLYKLSGPPKVLPMIQIQDRINGASYSWWTGAAGGSSGFLKAQVEVLHEAVRKDLLPKGFYSINPVRGGFRGALPAIFRNDQIPTEDALFVGEYFDSQIVVSGALLFKKSQKLSDAYEVEVKLTARHTSNGRVVGEVIRTYQTESGPMRRVINDKTREVFPTISKDLSVQLHDAWKSGTFGTTLIRLVVNGDLSFQRLKMFKEQFLNQVAGVKTLRERKFLPGQVVFEIDSDSSVDQITKAIAKTRFQNFQINVAGSGLREIELSVDTR